MTKVFISLPMRGLERSEIISKQGEILTHVNNKIGEPVMLVESFLDGNADMKPLECLGESLKRMAHADLAVFAKGWAEARGCAIEHMCAEKYGIPILDL